MSNFKVVDANTIVSEVAYKFSEVCGIYPITPSSPMAENIDLLSANHELNYFGNSVKIVEMQSEAGAIGMVHGALASGTLASTFTSSQGLLLMIPNLYKLSGELLPGVLHVAARSLSTHALSIFGDHQDIYAVRSTGVCMLASANVQESYHMAMISHLSAIKGNLPFIHFFDGFRTSHEINKLKTIDLEKVKDLIDNKALNDFRLRGMHSNNPNTRGTNQNEDIYFQNTESRNIKYLEIPDIVNEYMIKINKLCKTDYKPFNYYGSSKAKYVIIAMGSVCNTIKEIINELNKKNNIYGLIEVHLFRPFSTKYLLNVLPKTTEIVTVLERTKETTTREAMYLDVVNSLNNTNIKVLGGIFGLSSKDTTPSQIKAVYTNMETNKLDDFTIGILDDVTNKSLPLEEFNIPCDMTEFLIYGYGSDGMVSTSKDLIKIIGNNSNNYVQGYFQYDSKKSGGVTRSHIRISDKEILSSYYVSNPSLIVVSKDSYIYKYDILDNIKENGSLLLNTSLKKEELFKTLPNKVKYLLAKKNINLYTIDAYKLVNDIGLKNKISTCLEICIFHLIKIINDKKVISIMKENNNKRFLSKGKKIVEVNNKIVEDSISKLTKLEIEKNWLYLEYIENKDLSFNETINLLKGDSLPVSSFMDKQDGTLKPGTTKLEKRNVAEIVPCWLSNKCIECNSCVFTCPHGVIRPFLLDKKEDGVESIPSILPKDKEYALSISLKDCTGCGICSNNCPTKALEMIPNNSNLTDNFDYLINNNKNNEYLPKIMNVKNIGFTMPKFEFSGACSGCGEAAYLKNLTQVFSDNLIIANATGCSSIYGAAAPNTPYSIPWASSLFEDNSEFGLGILTGINANREKVKNYMLKHKNTLFTKWLENSNNYDICKEIENNIDYKKYPELLKIKDYITPKNIFIVGGDGFAYDIGFGGLDHILSRNENINILVLDTEVYSNTGGQSSKSSNLGSIASFTSHGKTNYKKDLARMAMCYPNTYVACVNIGYNKEQYIKVLNEAVNHDGPSLIIAYSPCIEHGIKNGMEHSLDNAKLATECGYFLTFRYSHNNLILDSKNVDFSKYEDYLMTENRFANLKNVNPKECEIILNNQKEWAIERYNYYKNLDKTIEK